MQVSHRQSGRATRPARVARMAGAVLLALLAGCKTIPEAVSKLSLPGSPAPFVLADPLPPPVPRAWPDAAADVLNQRARGYGLVVMPAMQGYLNGLLANIKAKAGVPTWPGEVHVLASPALEAYATAAGNIYLSQAWLASSESEDEIVALLSHEFAHVYLHYHQLEGAIETGNQAMMVVAVATALAQKTAAAAGWSHVDSLVVGYTLGRELAASAWGRSQESAADWMGLKLSLQLGYSYDAGFKAFLERQASWDESNAARQERIRAALLEQVKTRVSDSINANNKNPNSEFSKAVFGQLALLGSTVQGALHTSTEGVGDLWKQSSSSHPDTVARLDVLAAAVEPLPPQQLGEAATVAPWLVAQRHTATASTLAHYQLAARALENLSAPDALTAAREAASGVTATHALPLIALYKAQLAHPAAPTGRRVATDPDAVLDTNLSSAPDRAWTTVVERSARLHASGKGKQAQEVMDRGFGFFQNAGNAWPDAIAFYGPARGWDHAKKMAQTCGTRFPTLKEACTRAAASPADKARMAQESEKKAEQLVNRLMRKK